MYRQLAWLQYYNKAWLLSGGSLPLDDCSPENIFTLFSEHPHILWERIHLLCWKTDHVKAVVGNNLSIYAYSYLSQNKILLFPVVWHGNVLKMSCNTFCANFHRTHCVDIIWHPYCHLLPTHQVAQGHNANFHHEMTLCQIICSIPGYFLPSDTVHLFGTIWYPRWRSTLSYRLSSVKWTWQWTPPVHFSVQQNHHELILYPSTTTPDQLYHATTINFTIYLCSTGHNLPTLRSIGS